MNTDIIKKLIENNYKLEKNKKQKVLKYLFLLMKWNKKFNIISMKNPENIISKHILDSLNLMKYIKYGKVLDIGSGAGFPSIPLAIHKTKLNFYLLESKIKKISFIRYVVSSLNISNIFIYHIRLEYFIVKEKFSYIISRAFIDLNLLVNFFQTSEIKKCTIIIMNSYLNVNLIKKFFLRKVSNIKVINMTKTKNMIGHRNLIFFKMSGK